MEITRRLQKVFGEDALQKSAVYKWIDRFKSGWTETYDAPREGRPSSSVTEVNIKRVQDLLEEDRRIDIRFISEIIGISYGSVHHILTENLGLTKLCARWIPRLLTCTQMDARVVLSKSNLRSMDRDPDFYEKLITVDETWIHYYDPDSKQQSQQWLPRGSNPPLKARVTPSLGKVMATIFWDATGILLIDYLQKGLTINAQYYGSLIENDVRKALRKKRPGKLTRGIILLHDNARSHTARHTQEIIERLGWQLLPHPAYSPDLAPCDFYLFPRMKDYLRGFDFQSIEDLKFEVNKWVKAQDPGFFTRGFEKLADRYQKCIDLGGGYVEKCSIPTDDN